MNATSTGTSSKVSSVMEQYAQLKEEAGEKLLFFQMGEFYELFYNDAEVAAQALAITLTKRGTGTDNKPIPMCGVPVHTANNYLIRLLRQGFQIAICEQTEDPDEARRNRGYKAIVTRKITRIVTQATLIEDELIDGNENLYLASFGIEKQKGQILKALAWADISTGECFYSSECNYVSLLSAITPKEILIPESLLGDGEFIDSLSRFRSKLRPWSESKIRSQTIDQQIKTTFSLEHMSVIGSPHLRERMALFKLCDYLCQNFKSEGVSLLLPKAVSSGIYMNLGGMIHQHLELLVSSNKTKKGSLLAAIDRTKTAQGQRLFARRLALPLCHLESIRKRQKKVSWFYEQQDLRSTLRHNLENLSDSERALARICNKKAHPKDVLAVGKALNILKKAQTLIGSAASSHRQNLWGSDSADTIGDFMVSSKQLDYITDVITRALNESPPIKFEDGQVIRKGYAHDLDALREKEAEQQRKISFLELAYRKQTAIDSLRIKKNQAIGYFIEFHPRHANKSLPDIFLHRQSLSNAVRYITVEIETLNNDINTSSQQILELERKLFADLCSVVEENSTLVSKASDILSDIDWTCAVAQLARDEHYVCPQLTEDVGIFEIKKGRHPVVEQASAIAQSVFTPNDCSLTEEDRIWLLSGPNMAGKSTFLRQNAILAILAHIGSFVPAESARIGLLDSMFSRLGASDDITQGLSTFMVEMLDISTILHHANSRSLIILDEVGRGTATFDGMAIAWATLEHLHDQCRSLCIFATHYHELSSLSESLQGLSNHAMKVEEHKKNIVFLHQVVSGSSHRSYGIHVAALAKLPASVIRRAFEILKTFDNKNRTDFLPLLDAAPPDNVGIKEPETTEITALRDFTTTIAHINLDATSPKQALDLLFELQQQATDVTRSSS